MCTGFGLIVSKELKAYFMEPTDSGDCSHSDLLERLGWKENDDIHLRNFVRIEYPDWTVDSFRFDEENTLPGWAENNRNEIKSKCDRILGLCDAACAEYEKVHHAAWAEYLKVCRVACAEYEKVHNAAWAEYEKARTPAYADMIMDFSKIEGYVISNILWATTNRG